MSDSLQIGTTRKATAGSAAYRGGMARIRRQSQGQPAVVVLSDLDRELLAQALDAYVYTSGLSAAKVAAQLGVSRPYLYRLIGAEHIELERLIKLQELLGIYLLCEAEVEKYVDDLRSELLGRPLSDSWFEDQEYVKTSIYYVNHYLIRDLKGHLESWEEYDDASREIIRERYQTIEFAWQDSNYQLRKIYEYYSSVIKTLDIEDVADDMWHEINIKVPIVGDSDYWKDYEERIADKICDYYHYQSESIKGHGPTESENPGDVGAEDDELVPWVQEKLDEELTYHEKFCEMMLTRISEMESEVERIEQLCETRERALRRTSYRLSELHDVAENLEANSFLLTPKHKKSIVEWLAVHQPSVELISEDNWWARRSEFRCKKCGTVYTYNFRYLVDDIGPCKCSDERIVKALERDEYNS